MTLPWRWMATEISTSFTIATMVAAICVCPAESMGFGKTKRLRAPLTLETTLTSQSIHRVRFTSCHSTSTTNASISIPVRQEVGLNKQGSQEETLTILWYRLIQMMLSTSPIILETHKKM